MIDADTNPDFVVEGMPIKGEKEMPQSVGIFFCGINNGNKPFTIWKLVSESIMNLNAS